MIKLHDVENIGDHPGNLEVLKEALTWETSLKKALMESHEKLAKRVKDLEYALQTTLGHHKHDSTCPICRIAGRILRSYL